MMKKIYLAILAGSLAIACNSQPTENKSNNTNAMNEKQSIYQFKVSDINGNTFDFSSLKGKKVMIVNTASKCGFTPQYADLQKLYDKYKDAGFVIVGFPANDFMAQEPGTNEEIANFCQKNYGVTFPMMSKIAVTGKGKHPVYEFLTTESKNGLADSKVEWNFQKYLINSQGFLVKVLLSKTTPFDKEITDWIEAP